MTVIMGNSMIIIKCGHGISSLLRYSEVLEFWNLVNQNLRDTAERRFVWTKAHPAWVTQRHSCGVWLFQMSKCRRLPPEFSLIVMSPFRSGTGRRFGPMCFGLIVPASSPLL